MTDDNMKDAERQLDSLLDAVGELIEKEDQQAQILNFPRVKQLEFALEALKILLKDQDVKITSKLNEPFKSMGSVSVEGKNIMFSRTKWFNRVAGVASNVEVYPLTNGNIRMTFTFHGLTVPL